MTQSHVTLFLDGTLLRHWLPDWFVIHYYINKQILDSYLHTKSEKIWLLFSHLCVKLSVFAVSMATAGIWNFQASKPFIHMPYNISIKFHPIPSTLNFSRFLWQKKYLKIMSDKISGKFHPVPSTIANQRWISIRNIKIYLETKFRPNQRIFVFWWPFWIQNGRHSKPNFAQIGGFLYFVAILNFFNPPQKKSCHTLQWIFLQSFMKGIQIFFRSPPFLFPWQLRQSFSNQFRFFLAYLVPLDVDAVPIKFHQFLFGE